MAEQPAGVAEPRRTQAQEYALANHQEVPCGRCEAKINTACLTLSGDVAGEPHTVRLRPLEDAFYAGTEDG